MAGAARRGVLRGAAAFLGRTLLVFVFFEGLLSVTAVLHGIARSRLAAERLHTRYDPELGWVATPNLALPNLYGPGVGLHTNSHGFRGRTELSDSDGRARIVCSGDSFTLGFGVADEQTWCHLLASAGSPIETVNMGQGGYGLDQAYLWYKRDGAKLHHDVHIIAFISADLDRMLQADFFGFGKPYLQLEDGRLVVRNVPVPRGPYRVPWLTAVAPRLYELRSLSAVRALLRPLAPGDSRAQQPDQLLPIVVAVFDDLEQIARRRGRRLVIVYLPTLADYVPGPVDGLRAELAAELSRRGLVLWDLVPDLRSLPPEAVDRLFLPGAGIGRHYSPEGHERVAARLARGLAGLSSATAAEPLADEPR